MRRLFVNFLNWCDKKHRRFFVEKIVRLTRWQ